MTVSFLAAVILMSDSRVMMCWIRCSCWGEAVLTCGFGKEGAKSFFLLVRRRNECFRVVLKLELGFQISDVNDMLLVKRFIFYRMMGWQGGQ